jgi:molybdopterin molybdotransferase
MLLYSQALDIIRNEGSAKPLAVVTTDLDAIAGRVCATDVASRVANQPFDNSAMDGYAVRLQDFPAGGAVLEIAGLIAAGDVAPTRALKSGQCWEIMTGAPLPAGVDAIIPVEKADRQGEKVTFPSTPAISENIRRVGQDYTAGDIVLKRGTALKPQHVLSLATVGIKTVQVFTAPKAGIISTGKEVTDDLAATLKPGAIYNATNPYLRVALPGFGFTPVSYGTVQDDPAIFRQRLEKALGDNCDIILSTGAVSAGVHDFVPSILKEMGAETLFHKVAIRPGKPLLFARFPKGGPFFFGLPGNPVSTAAGLRFFVYPLLRAMQGLPPEQPRRAVLSAPYQLGKPGLRFFLRIRLQQNGPVLEAEVPQKQQSFMVSTFAECDGWLMADENAVDLEKGTVVDVFPWQPNQLL